jgi:ATP-dependent DNA ligase
MNRSKKIEDLIDLVPLLKGSGEGVILKALYAPFEPGKRNANMMKSSVNWGLADMVEYYNENRSGTLGE